MDFGSLFHFPHRCGIGDFGRFISVSHTVTGWFSRHCYNGFCFCAMIRAVLRASTRWWQCRIGLCRLWYCGIRLCTNCRIDGLLRSTLWRGQSWTCSTRSTLSKADDFCRKNECRTSFRHDCRRCRIRRCRQCVSGFGWSTGSGFDLASFSSLSSECFCIFGLHGLTWLSNFCPSVLWRC